jgi:dihydropteroate synthase
VILELGTDHRFDITHRALVMGILNRTPDSFFDGGEYFAFDDFLAKAEQLIADGADFVDIGGIRLKPGDEVGVEEELERVVPSVEALAARFDTPISVDTFRAEVAEACFAAGASVGNDTSGFADPEYLHVAAEAGASVVASHVRTAPRLADPNPVYDDVVTDVLSFLRERAGWAMAAGIPRQRIMVDAALDLGKNAAMSTQLLFATDRLAALGFPTFLSASNKGFLGQITGAEVGNRSSATHAAHVLGIMAGARVLRAHDVRGTRRLADTISEVLQRRGVEAPDSVSMAGSD